jgi:hypothetical protein
MSLRCPDPVFVVGMNGSGTTMLADSLGRHPSLYMFRLEAKVLPHFLAESARTPLDSFAARRRMADAIGATKAVWQANGRRPLVLRDEQLAEPGFAGVAGAVFGEFAAREGKVRWGEKSPMNLAHLEALAAAWPAARFVHIVRDAREAAQSFHRRYGYSPVHTVYRWKKLVAQGRAQGLRLGTERYLELRYEDLTRDPEAGMRRVCGFLGLPFDAVVVESSMRMTGEAVDRSAGRIVENSDKWRLYFDEPTVQALERVAGRALRESGYAVTIEGDEDPSPWLRRWWRARDRVALARQIFAERGLKSLPGLLRAARTAKMQDGVRRA